MEMMAVVLYLILMGVPYILSIAALVIAARSRSRQAAPALGRVVERHEQKLAALESELRALRDQLRRPTAGAPQGTASPAEPAAAPVAPAAPQQAPAPPIPPQPAIQTPITPPAPVAGPKPSERILPVVLPSKPPASPPPPPPATPFWKIPSFDWEGLVGVKLFSWIAGIALLLAAIFFLLYSIERGWLMPPVRVAIGAAVGILLLVICELRAARKYPVTANAMDAAAIAILFSTFFAARALWGLIDAASAFFLLVLVAVVAVLLSIRRDSMFIALLGLLGGFAIPAILSTGENRPISLFSYLLLLNAGLAWIAAKKRWPLLTALTLVFTTLYQWGWVMKFLTAAQLPLAAGIFLAFPILSFATLALNRKEEGQSGWGSWYGNTANLSALLPLLFAAYLASVSGYGVHYTLLFGFLFLLDLGLFAIAAARGHEILHLAGGISTIMVFAIWLLISYAGEAWPAVLAFVALFVLFYLAAPLILLLLGRKFTGLGRNVVYAAPLLLFAFSALAAIEPRCAHPGLVFAILFLLLAAAAAFAIFAEEGAVYFLAAFAALSAEAVWSAKYLTEESLLPGLALYGIFGLFYIGIPMAARRWHKKLQPEGAGMALLFASLALLLFLAAGPTGGVALWGLSLLLLVLNLGLFLEGSVARFPAFAVAGIVLSWTILACFWMNAALDLIVLPALIVIAGFALFAMGGLFWLQGRMNGEDAGVLRDCVYLGLVGHLFLIVVASQRALSIPPWPLLGVLLVLDLAAGIASLYARRHELHVAAMAASALVLSVWVLVAGGAPWPAVAILSAGAMALLSFFWIHVAKRLHMETARYADTAAFTVFLAQAVTIVAAQQPGSPEVGFLLTAHLVFLAALLGLAWVRKKHYLAILAAGPTTIAVSLWIARHAGPEFRFSQLLFAGLVYLAYLCYPLLLGRRAGHSFEPYLAAVLASVPFFFQARHTIMAAGWEGYIGILPVVQAVLMAALLSRLLGIDPPERRALGRLALVAGAALAFITVAIPLQLEKEWITIGWALEGAALAWLFTRIPHRGLCYVSGSLLAVVFVRLALNPSVLEYAPRGALPIWNWYLYTYLVSAAALILAGRLFAKTIGTRTKGWRRITSLLPAGGAILLFLLLNIEIADFYSTGERITFQLTATLAQDLTFTLGWALFAVVLLAVGIVAASRPSRIAALALLVATILKCFLHDLGRLGGLYRVMSFVGLALCLALVAVALQKFVLSVRKETQ
jgi:uncharacterized membrane protein